MIALVSVKRYMQMNDYDISLPMFVLCLVGMLCITVVGIATTDSDTKVACEQVQHESS